MDTLDYMINPQYQGSRIIRGAHSLSTYERLAEIDELEDLLTPESHASVDEPIDNPIYRVNNKIENLVRD